MDLSNIHCIVTGGNGKIGSSVCASFLDCGAKVSCISRSNDLPDYLSAINENNQNLYTYQCDVANKESFGDIFRKVLDSGKVTTLVNCTSFRPSLLNEEGDDIKHWSQSILQNSLALAVPTFELTKYFKDHRINGSVISLSSIYGIVGPRFEIYQDTELTTEADYAYNKSAIIGFNKYMAAKYAKYNITFNVIAPGGVSASQSQEFRDNYYQIVPMRRMAEANDISYSCCFFASEYARYITGVVMPIDGGWLCV